MSVAALVLGAGRGTRLRGEVPKAFVLLAGRAILLRALDAMAACAAVETIVPVVPEEAEALLSQLEPELARVPRVSAPVIGGAQRQDSVRRGLASLGVRVKWVAVHDAARCLVGREDVARVIDAARRSGAAILATPLRDTVKRVAGGEVQATPPREELWAAQTPQVFRRELLEEALAKAEADHVMGTDCASLVERLGARVVVVEGDPWNVKITTREDLVAAEARLARP